MPAAASAQGAPGAIPGDIFLNGGPPQLGGPTAPDAGGALGGDLGGGLGGDTLPGTASVFDPAMMSGGMYPGAYPGMQPGMPPMMQPGMQPGMYPGGYGGGYGGGPGGPTDSGQLIDFSPQHDWWPSESFWSTFTKKVLPNSYFRAEFLNWNIDTFGSKVIGAENFVAGVRQPFVAFLDDGSVRLASVPNAQEIDLENTQGVRFTLGLPTRQGGAIELAYWKLFDAQEVYRDWRAGGFDAETALPQVVAIPMYDRGGLGQTAVLFDRSWSASFHSDVSGIEVKYYYDMSPTGTGVYIQPIFGIRSNTVDEEFYISGRTDIGGSRVANVDSMTENFIIGPQVGVRLEVEWWKFRFGMDPRVGGGFNFYDTRLRVANWRFAGDHSYSDDDGDVKFSGMFEVGLYGKFALHPNVTLFGGYNLLYLSRVTRPLDNIYFNDNPGSSRTLVRLTPDLFDMHVDGLNVGAEIRWR